MPMVRVYTNVTLEKSQEKEFIKSVSKTVATELKVPEAFVSVSVFLGTTMLYGGSDEPCAQAYIMSIGGMNRRINKKTSNKLGILFDEYLNVPSGRYCIQFTDCSDDFVGY